MFKIPYVYDLLGHCYRVYHRSQGGLPAKTRYRSFSDDEYAYQFLQDLQCEESYWKAVLEQYGDEPWQDKGDPNESVLRAVAQQLVQQRLLLYRVASPNQLRELGSKACFPKSDRSLWQVLPPANLEGASRPLKTFGSLEQARAFLLQLNPAPEQLKAMSQLAGRQHWNPAKPVSSVARELQENNLVVVEQPVVAKPPTASQSAADSAQADIEDSAANQVGHAMSTLGPHVDSGAEQDEQEPEEETPVCELNKFMLRCGHFGKRGYMLDALNTEPNHNGVHKAIQVLSQRDANADKIHVAFSGYCGEGKATCPAITIQGEGIEETVTQSPHEFTVHPPEEDVEVNSFTDFLKHYLLPDLSGIGYNTYDVSSSGCASVEQRQAQVHVFPTCKWSGSAKMGYCYNDDASSDEPDSDKRKKWALEGEIKGNYGTKKWELSAGNGEKTDDYFPSLRETLVTVADKIEKLIDYHGLDEEGNRVKPRLVKPNIVWPKVALSGDIGLEEVKSRYNIDVGGRVALSMNPLIEAGLTLDLVGWALNALPGYGQFLQEVRARAAEGIGTEKASAKAVIEINLTLKGALKGDLAWEKPAGRPWQCSSSGQAKLVIELEAKVEGEAKFFMVKIKVGMAASLKSAGKEAEGVGAIFNLKAVVADGKPALDGYVQFTGAAIYYTYYAEVAKEDVNSDEKNTDRKARRGRKQEVGSDSGGSYKESKMKKLVNILPEARFPKEPGRYTLDKVDF